jgi:hypothetical protein
VEAAGSSHVAGDVAGGDAAAARGAPPVVVGSRPRLSVRDLGARRTWLQEAARARAENGTARASFTLGSATHLPLVASTASAAPAPPTLPTDILVRLLRFVPLRSRVRAGGVARAWHAASAQGSLWRHADFACDFDDSRLDALATHPAGCPPPLADAGRLSDLHTRAYHIVGDVALAGYFSGSRFSQLAVLDLSFCARVTRKGLLAALPACAATLVVLRLRFLSCVDDACLQALLDESPPVPADAIAVSAGWAAPASPGATGWRDDHCPAAMQGVAAVEAAWEARASGGASEPQPQAEADAGAQGGTVLCSSSGGADGSETRPRRATRPPSHMLDGVATPGRANTAGGAGRRSSGRRAAGRGSPATAVTVNRRDTAGTSDATGVAGRGRLQFGRLTCLDLTGTAVTLQPKGLVRRLAAATPTLQHLSLQYTSVPPTLVRAHILDAALTSWHIAEAAGSGGRVQAPCSLVRHPSASSSSASSFLAGQSSSRTRSTGSTPGRPAPVDVGPGTLCAVGPGGLPWLAVPPLVRELLGLQMQAPLLTEALYGGASGRVGDTITPGQHAKPASTAAFGDAVGARLTGMKRTADSGVDLRRDISERGAGESSSSASTGFEDGPDGGVAAAGIGSFPPAPPQLRARSAWGPLSAAPPSIAGASANSEMDEAGATTATVRYSRLIWPRLQLVVAQQAQVRPREGDEGDGAPEVDDSTLASTVTLLPAHCSSHAEFGGADFASCRLCAALTDAWASACHAVRVTSLGPGGGGAGAALGSLLSSSPFAHGNPLAVQRRQLDAVLDAATTQCGCAYPDAHSADPGCPTAQPPLSGSSLPATASAGAAGVDPRPEATSAGATSWSAGTVSSAARVWAGSAAAEERDECAWFGGSALAAPLPLLSGHAVALQQGWTDGSVAHEVSLAAAGVLQLPTLKSLTEAALDGTGGLLPADRGAAGDYAAGSRRACLPVPVAQLLAQGITLSEDLDAVPQALLAFDEATASPAWGKTAAADSAVLQAACAAGNSGSRSGSSCGVGGDADAGGCGDADPGRGGRVQLHLFAAWMADKTYRWALAERHCRAALALAPDCGSAALHLAGSLVQASGGSSADVAAMHSWLDVAEVGPVYVAGTLHHVFEQRAVVLLRQGAGYISDALDAARVALHFAPWAGEGHMKDGDGDAASARVVAAAVARLARDRA